MKSMLLLIVFLPFALGILSFAVSKKNEKIGSLTAVISSAGIFILTLLTVLVFGISDKAYFASSLGLSFMLDGFRAIYALIIAFMWLGAALLSPQYFKHHKSTGRYYFFFLATLGATMGVFLSADLYTTFLFFEIMSLTSYAWVIQDETKDALSAGKTYLTIAISGGLVTLMGLFILYSQTGTLEISILHEAVNAVENKTAIYSAAFCLLFGFAAKAGLFPLHIWLPKAHPVAPAPASALLSGVLTKAGIFGIIVITAQIMRGDVIWGNLLLILGVITMVLGALLALFSTNLKYILACSSLSQIGFITIGISMLCLLGEENALASSGVVLYMLNHSLVKLTLFLSAGVIYANTHSLDLNEIKGFGRGKKTLTAAFACGGLSLAGFPLFCGYISKTLIHEAIVEYAAIGSGIITIVEWLFLISGGLTLAYVLKLFIAIFVSRPADKAANKQYITVSSAVSVLMGPAVLITIGVLPNLLADKIGVLSLSFTQGHAAEHAVHYFSLENLRGIGISIVIGLLIYLLVVRGLLMKNGRYLAPHLGFSLEENIYVPFFGAVKTALIFISRTVSDLPAVIVLLLHKSVLRSEDLKGDRWHPVLTRLGNAWDRCRGNKNKLTAENLINAYATLHDTTDKILSNFSFALIMTCFGICLMLMFLIFR